MLALLVLLVLSLPVLELWLLLQVGGVIGAPLTIGLVLLTAFVGAWFARREGFKAATKVHQASQMGELPTRAMFDSLAVFVGGALLLPPGFITDAVGLMLLLPPGRRFILAAGVRLVKRRIRQAANHGRVQVRWETSSFSDPFSQQEPMSRAGPREPGTIIDATFDEIPRKAAPEVPREAYDEGPDSGTLH